MSTDLENRIAVLEKEVARLQRNQQAARPTGREWVDDLYGKFAGDPIFRQAMKLGRKYRQSLHPRVRKTKTKR